MLKQIKNLKLYYEGNEYEWEIPCSLFSLLSKNGCLPDPYKDDNEKLYISAAEKDCSFVANFEFHPIGEKSYVLRIGAIDTIAKIYLNGKFIGENTSAFYPFQTVLSYSDFLDGDNVLRIDIQSPITYLNDKNKKHYVDSQMDTGKVGLFGRAAMRKPQYSFGWDWGAALPDLGIYEPITIEEKKTRLNDFTIKQIHKDGKVKLVLSSEITCRCRLYSPENEYIGETTSGNGVSEILVNKPQLWWCNNLGPQPLYTLTIEYQDEYLGETIKETKRIGLRTIEISQELDEWGREFAFVLNGQKIFAFGANYIPEDQIIPWYDVARTKDLLQKCKQANFNMIRVWGGGIYPSDTFYDTCDELGIIVWLDFMFACQSVYLTEEFRNNVQKEIEYQVKRISTHASLGLLCGNNEGEYMIADRSHKSYECLMHRPSLDAMDYLELYEHIIPDICEKYAPDTFYWSCSPSSGGGFYLAQNENFGDSHVWNCWEENKPLDSYKNNYPRFLSEFGFISYPSLDMIRTFTDNKIESITDESVKSHFKKLIYTPNMQEILSKWNEELFGKTDAIEEIVNNSQILQGKMLKGFIEHMRIHRGRCMGALIWQLNDSMPSVSWSLIDYAGGEKLSLQAVKEAFAPTIAIVEENNGYLDVYVSNETPSAYIGTLQIEKLNYEKSVSVEPFSTKQIDRLPWQGNTQTLEEVICKLSR